MSQARSLTARFSFGPLSLAALAGASLVFSVIPWPNPLFVFVGAAAFFAALTPQGEVVGLGRAFLVGLVTGTLASAGVMYWMPGMFVAYGGFPLWAAWLTGFGVFLWHAGPFVLSALLTSLVVRRGASPLWVMPVSVAVSFGVVMTLFPWRLAVGAVPFLPFVQLAEVGGQPLVDFAICLVGAGAVTAFRNREKRGERAFRIPALVSILALLLPTVYGLVRIPMVESERQEGQLVRLGVVQPNVGIDEKHDPHRASEILLRLQRLTLELQEQGAEAALWPESAYPRPFPRAARADLPREASVRGPDVRIPIVFGAITSAGGCRRWNSTISLEQGRIGGVVDKVRLVPFSEVVPFYRYFPAIRAQVECPGFLQGSGDYNLPLLGHRVGVFNCYEDILSNQSFQVGRGDPHFLVNVTNDAWFGDTFEPQLHHQAARLRTIETRRDLVRSVNTGISGHYTATGQELHRTGTYEEATFIAEVRTMEGRTLFVGYGPILVFFFWLALAFPLVRALRQAYRRYRRLVAKEEAKDEGEAQAE